MTGTESWMMVVLSQKGDEPVPRAGTQSLHSVTLRPTLTSPEGQSISNCWLVNVLASASAHSLPLPLVETHALILSKRLAVRAAKS
jgi:hypothetical protein